MLVVMEDAEASADDKWMEVDGTRMYRAALCMDMITDMMDMIMI